MKKELSWQEQRQKYLYFAFYLYLFALFTPICVGKKIVLGFYVLVVTIIAIPYIWIPPILVLWLLSWIPLVQFRVFHVLFNAQRNKLSICFLFIIFLFYHLLLGFFVFYYKELVITWGLIYWYCSILILFAIFILDNCKLKRDKFILYSKWILMILFSLVIGLHFYQRFSFNHEHQDKYFKYSVPALFGTAIIVEIDKY